MNPPVMTTADMALKMDPSYRKIAERFLANPEEFRLAFAKAWYKLTHRDLGPRARYLGKDVPSEEMIWQDPVPAGEKLGSGAVNKLKKKILDSGLTVPQLIRTAWASAGSFRASDMRGGANGARVRLNPQSGWDVNNPTELALVLKKLEEVRKDFNGSFWQRQKVSMADTIVIAGAAAVEKAASDAGVSVKVKVRAGRGDATQAQTDVNSFSLIELKADAFRNYYSEDAHRSPTEMMVDRADQLNLTVPEMTVLVGGMRVLGGNAKGSTHGVFTDKPGTLSNDFFVNLLDMSTKWIKDDGQEIFKGMDRKTNQLKYTATPVDLVFGSNSELRAIAEVYAMDDAKKKFVEDFVKAWTKVMQLDRFDLRHNI